MMKSAVEKNVMHSSGPDVDPFSMYSTTHSLLHDLKQPLNTGPCKKPEKGMGGFARNNMPTVAKEVPDVPNPRKLGRSYNKHIDDPAAPIYVKSVAKETYSPQATVLGERGKILDELHEADMAASIVKQRGKFRTSAFTTNGLSPSLLQEEATAHPNHTTELAKALLGRKDPVALENNFAGPAPMSTTHKAGFVAHSEVDPALLDPNAVLDIDQIRVPFSGSGQNQAPTLFFKPHDGWNPSTESRDAWKRHETDILDTLQMTNGRKRAPVANLRASANVIARKEDEAHAPMTYLQQQRMKNSDPIRFNTLKEGSEWRTTSGDAFGALPDRTKTSLDDVVNSNETARHLLRTVPDATLLVHTLSGAPHKKAASGFARNTVPVPDLDRYETVNPTKLSVDQASRCRVSKRIEFEPQILQSIYKADFRDQMKLPLPSGQFRELRKHTSGFDRCNRDSMFQELPDDPDKWTRKV